MKYFAIFVKNDAAIFQLQWNIGNIPDMFLQYSVLCGLYLLRIRVETDYITVFKPYVEQQILCGYELFTSLL